MKEQAIQTIKISEHPNKLKDYFSLYLNLVFIPFIIMVILIPVFLGVAIWGMISGQLMAILCIALYALSGIFLAYIIMFNIIAPIRANKVSQKLVKEESNISIYKDSVGFCSVYVVDGQTYKDEKIYPFKNYKKIKEKKDRFLFRSNKEYGNYAFYIYKDTLNDSSLKLLQSKLTK